MEHRQAWNVVAGWIYHWPGATKPPFPAYTTMFTATTEFTAFLRTAKLSTYAAQGDEASVRPLLPDSRQLEFSSEPFLYRDIYVGTLRFVGKEVVYLSQRAVWAMAYSGGLVSAVATSDSSSIYQALRAALSATPEAFPVRGPRAFRHHNLDYECMLAGGLERFHGRESISRNGQLVYELHFSGGGLA